MRIIGGPSCGRSKISKMLFLMMFSFLLYLSFSLHLIVIPRRGLLADENVIRKIMEEVKEKISGTSDISSGSSDKEDRENSYITNEKGKEDGKDFNRDDGTKSREPYSRQKLAHREQKTVDKEAVARPHLNTSRVYVVRVEGAIGPAVANFVTESLERSAKEGANLFVILLDTPGGLDAAMRDIVRAIESSYVPVCVFVWPAGARAASAGTFITVSSHIAAMAPGTSIGAASPVLMGGEKMDKKLRKKVENDAIAYIRALAQRHGRNAEALERTVKDAATFTAEESLKIGIIDVIAENIDDLLSKISGRKITTITGEVVLNFRSYEIVKIEPNIKHKLLKVISDPNIAYILMTIGIWGIFFELANPGAVFPGVIGAICLVLGLYSLQALPVNWAGIALILLAIVFFLLEVKLATSGVLALAGVLSMFLGSIMLFESPEPIFRASYKAIISTTLATALFFIFVAYKAVAAHRVRSLVGFEGLLEQIGSVISNFENGRGKILVNGEIWGAQVEDPGIEIKRGDTVRVISHKGMTLIVRKEEK